MQKIISRLVLPMLLTCSSFSFAAVCNKTISNTALGQLTVPAGATCTLNMAAVEGSINVQQGENLILNNTAVSGAIQASAARSLKLVNSSIEGDVNAAQGSAQISLDKAMISGNLYCSSSKLRSSMSSIEGKVVGKCQ